MFLFSIDGARGLTKEHTSVVAGKKKVERFLIMTPQGVRDVCVCVRLCVAV